MLLTPLHNDVDSTWRAASKFTALMGWCLRVADLALLVVGGILSTWLLFGGPEMPQDYRQMIARGVLVGLFVFSASTLYRSWRGRGLVVEILTLTTLWTTLFVLVALYSMALQLSQEISRLWWLSWFGMSLTGAILARVAFRRGADWLREQGVDARSAVVVGAGVDAERIVRTFSTQRWLGINILGWFSTPADTGEVTSVPKLGTLDMLRSYIEARHVDQIWIALPMSAQHEIGHVLESLPDSTADIKLVPDLFGLQLLNHSVEQIGGLPVINLRASPLAGEARVVKAIEDRLLALVILTLISPLMLAIALGVKLSSPGPVMFRQRRHGIDGRVIEVWKFRSMKAHAESGGKVTQASRQDPRVTPFGRFLRRTSLDELPQFINVLQGTMSIVGPRPHAVEHNQHYRKLVQGYMQRHRVKPGITGWAQVNGLRGETDTLDKMARRIEYDLYYLQNWSLVFDLKIILLTVFKGFIGKSAY